MFRRHVLWRKLLRDMWARKGSLLALAVVVALGVGFYTAMAAVYRDMDGARRKYYTEQRLADFTLDLKRAPVRVVREIAALPNVRAVRARVRLGVLLDLPWRDEPITGTAISMPRARSPVLNDVLLRSGIWFTGRSEQEVILNDAFARANHLRPGSRIRVTLLDQQYDLLVVGTAMSPEFVYLIPPGGALAPDPARFGVMYLPETFLQNAGDLQGACNQIIGWVHDTTRTALANTLTRIEDRLDVYGVLGATPTSDQPSVRFLADELVGIKVSAAIVPAIFLVVAALILNVVLGRLVTEQRPIIGTLLALGHSSATVLVHYLSLGIVVGALGGLGGLAFGWWMQNAMLGMYREFFALPEIRAHVYPGVMATGLAISLVCAAAGTIKGVWLAARLAPAVAMRPLPPEHGGRIFLERFTALWRVLPFHWKMILRTVARNPLRSGASILANTLATALIVLTLIQVDALDYLIHYEFERVAHQDLTIGLREPVARDALDEVLAFPSVAAVEPQLAIACDLMNGPHRKRIAVTGIVRGSRLYTPLDKAGNRLRIADKGLVLSRKLATIIRAGVGDTVRLRPLIGLRQEVRATVVGIVDTFFGLAAYAEIGYLSRLLGEEWVANVILTKQHTGAWQRPVFTALKQRPSVVGVNPRSRSLKQLQDLFQESLGTMIFSTVLFAGLMAFGSVLNAALVSLNERRREVGTLCVLGYTPGQVWRIFRGESFLLGVIGAVLGIGVGIALARLMFMAYDTEMYRFPLIIRAWSLLTSAALMLAFVGAAQIVIYRLIRKLVWVDALNIKE